MSHNAQYNQYLKSAAWHRRRGRAIVRSGNQCEYVLDGKRCQARTRLHAHHKHYQTFRRETARDLQVLCEDHHAGTELSKGLCIGCGKPVFSSMAEALTHWKKIRNKYIKDWAEALCVAEASRKVCAKCAE